MAIDLDWQDNKTGIQFQNALSVAFLTYDDFVLLYGNYLQKPSGLRRLMALMPDGGLISVIFQICQHAEAKGYGLELLVAALIMNPTNPTLLQFADTVPLKSGPNFRDEERVTYLQWLLELAYSQNRVKPIRRLVYEIYGNATDDLPTNQKFEALFLPPSFQNPIAWRQRMEQSERRICRIAFKTDSGELQGFGTGFLVAPDLILTAFHVYEAYPEQWPGHIRCQFDYVETDDSGTVVSLASEKWLVDSSDINNLDFALLRLATPMESERGYERPQESRVPNREEQILILQYPSGGTLKLSSSGVRNVRRAQKRIEYLANTLPGSSGSPCFDSEWKLVGMHHTASDTNRGILMEAISQEIKPYLPNP